MKKSLKEIFFPVKKVAGKDIMPDYQFNKRHSHFIIGETDEGPKIIQACSPGYELIPNEQLLSPIVEAMKKEFNLTTRVMMRGFSKFFVDLKFMDEKTQIAKDDILPKITMQNSYDGTLKFQMSAGLERVVCTNGMTVPVKDKDAHMNLSFRHTSSSSQAIDEALKFADNFVKNISSITKVYDKLVGSKMSKAVADMVLEELHEEKLITKDMHEMAQARLQEEINMGLEVNQWLVYNAANYAINHLNENMLPNKKAALDLKLITSFIK